MGDPVQGMPIGTLRNVEEPADAPGNGDTPGHSRVALIYLTAAAIVVADQAAKLAAVEWLRSVDSVPITSWLKLTWATNTGGAFGLLDSRTGVLSAVAGVIVLTLILITPRLATGRLLAVSLASVMGGALGNLIDRVRIGYVIDYIDLNFWPLVHWPVFNIADIAITVGAALLVIATLLGHPYPESSREDSD